MAEDILYILDGSKHENNSQELTEQVSVSETRPISSLDRVKIAQQDNPLDVEWSEEYEVHYNQFNAKQRRNYAAKEWRIMEST